LAGIRDSLKGHVPWRIYAVCFGAVSLLLALSPFVRMLSVELPYDRACELLVALMVIWTVLARRLQLPREWAGTAIFFTAFLLVSAAINSQFSSLFHPTLVLLDAKILLCIVAMWILGDIELSDTRTRKMLAGLVYGGFVVGVAAFGLLSIGSGRRLELLDESNYMVLALVISSVVLIDAYRIKVMSFAWLALLAVLLAASLLAQSRTGFIAIGLVAVSMLWAANRRGVVLAVGFLALLAAIVDMNGILAALTRGETDLEKIDRLVFLNEALLQWSNKTVSEILFGNSVGAYLSETSRAMNYWVARQSTEQGIPYGLAPYNFHALALRLPLDIGIVPSAILILSVSYRLYRTTSIYVTFALLISCASMSVFYLSTVMPFIVLAQLVRPTLRRRDDTETATQAAAMRPAITLQGSNPPLSPKIQSSFERAP